MGGGGAPPPPPPGRAPGAAGNPGGGGPHGVDRKPVWLSPTPPRGLDGPQDGCPIIPTPEPEPLLIILTPPNPPSPEPIPPTPIPPPKGAIPVSRLAAAGTTSSSSAASADEPNIPFGLGDLFKGEIDPGLGFSPPFAVVLVLVDPVGRAMGAIGREIGPGFCTSEIPDALADPNVSGRTCMLRRPDPGANEDGRPAPDPPLGVVGDPEGPVSGVLGFEGGPMGDGIPEG